MGGTVGLIVSIPLLDSGQRSAEARQMEAMRRRSEAELKEMELRVATEVRQARLEIRDRRRKLPRSSTCPPVL